MSQTKSLTLDERLRELWQRGNRSEAKSLAVAALKNEPIHEVVIENNRAHVVTPRFRGVHRISRGGDESILLEKEGEYTYDGDEIDLSFTATTLSNRVYDVVRDRLTDDPDPGPDRKPESDPEPSGPDTDSPGDAPSEAERDEQRRPVSNLATILARLPNVSNSFSRVSNRFT